MPKDNIERAVKKSYDENAENYEEVRYEGFGIEGIGIIVESLTDNRNRTAGDIRSIFSKHGGNLGETGSVSFMFNHLGIIKFSSEAGSFEDVFEIATDAGALDCDITDDGFEISCSTGDLHQVAEIIESNVKIYFSKINLDANTTFVGFTHSFYLGNIWSWRSCRGSIR